MNIELHRLHLTADAARVDTKADEDGLIHTLTGYGSAFGNVDAHGDVIRRGAFDHPDGLGRVPGGRVKLLDSHVPDSAHVIGTVVEARETRKGLRLTARLSATSSAQEVARKVAEGHLGAMSIGYTPLDWEWRSTDGGDRVRHLTRVKLHEVSVVAFPANEAATIEGVKHQNRRHNLRRRLDEAAAGLPTALVSNAHLDQRDVADNDRYAEAKSTAARALECGDLAAYQDAVSELAMIERRWGRRARARVPW